MKKCILPFPTLDISLSQKDWHTHATEPKFPLPSDILFTLQIITLNNHQTSKYDLFFNVCNYPTS